MVDRVSNDGLTSDAWARVTTLFDEARERPADERQALLRARGADETTCAEVQAMLAAYDADPGFLEPSPDLADTIARALAGGLIGRRLGAYRLLREVGRGGMGLVYEARRDDQEFDRRAAVKILPAWSAAWQAERFRFERQVLAGLDHPGIARLLDAGTTADGVPYFVMEFVDGQPIDAWCRDRRLDPRQRVLLIERVCDALAYAHQHLVIHRDVKPANILVTSGGDPKLLDFGIAALLTSEGEASAGTTRTGHHSFTPRYASPEQIRGERVTTASDVYSLGVVLYLLLAGREPFTLAGVAPLEAMRIVCEEEPPSMSAAAAPSLADELAGDLDAIVAKALAKRPEDRYGTVAELVADLRAWRERRPVTARAPTIAYRLRRYVRRNRGPLAAAGALSIAVIAGVAATWWQARVAEQERSKAQNRFRQLQVFSRSLLFDVHDAIRELPGATEPRRLLLDRAVQLLDGLAADAAGDEPLQRELAEAYRRLSSVQGASNTENVGDTRAAIASLRKATGLIDPLQRAAPADVARVAQAAEIHELLASALQSHGETADADRAHQRQVALLDTLAGLDGGDDGLALANGYTGAGIFRAVARDLPGARAFYEKALAIYERRPPETRAAGDRLRPYSLILKRLGAVEMVTGQLDASERHYRAALALEEEGLRRDPGNARLLFEQTFTITDLGEAIRRRGRVDDAIALWARAMAIREAAVAADPANTRAITTLASLRSRLGRAYRDRGRLGDAIALLRAAVRAHDDLAARQRGNVRPEERDWVRLTLAGTLLERAVADGAGVRTAVDDARALLPPDREDGSGHSDPDYPKELARVRNQVAALSGSGPAPVRPARSATRPTP
jgi:non-specific serine/threonine protein kinase/serine/threonine-protein kinase